MNPIKVLLAEDHTIVREGFRRMLELDSSIVVVGEAQDGREAIMLAQKLCPDVILMDIAMPRLNGLEATRQLLKIQPNVKVMILSAHNDDAYVTDAINSGASGFLLKQTSARDVCGAIRQAYNGKSYFSPSISKRLSRLNSNPQERISPFHKKTASLTSRETEVLQLIAEGKANKETASELCISIKTVEKHRGNLMRKLDIHDTAGLTRYAISTGVIESSVQVTIL